jgi:hypothetical protein
VSLSSDHPNVRLPLTGCKAISARGVAVGVGIGAIKAGGAAVGVGVGVEAISARGVAVGVGIGAIKAGGAAVIPGVGVGLATARAPVGVAVGPATAAVSNTRDAPRTSAITDTYQIADIAKAFITRERATYTAVRT